MHKIVHDQDRPTRADVAFGVLVAVAGIVIAGMSYAHLGDKPHVLAQATPQGQLQPAAPGGPKPIQPGEGARPTTIAPEPARPDAEAQKAGAQPALPPAPAEKVGEPVPERK